ncbi:hypothetical protein L211DRAFT_842323, partial [Terfezia boudieri ATCC MYA-4762]
MSVGVDWRSRVLSLITITCYNVNSTTCSDLEIVDDEEADGSDNEHGNYITEEEATQYATERSSVVPGFFFFFQGNSFIR